MALTPEDYRAVTGDAAPEDLDACVQMAQTMLDARTLCFYAGRAPESLPVLIRRVLQQYLAYQAQAMSQAGGVAAANEAAVQSATLGRFSIAGGVGGNAHCPAAAALLPLLISYARCD